MHYVLKETTSGIFQLTTTYVDEDYDGFIKQFPHLQIYEINQLWFNYKANLIHNIGKAFCAHSVLWCTVEDSLFPTIKIDIDLKDHAEKFEECDSCKLKEHFELQFQNYESDLETMLNMVCS